MFFEYWQLVVFIIVTGLWAEWRYIKGRASGIFAGVDASLKVLETSKIISINKQGEVVRYDD